MASTPTPEIIVIDDDFMQAARYYNNQMFGGAVEDHFRDLKHEYEVNENLNPLVYLFAQQRTKYTNSISNPKHVCNNNLVRGIISWTAAPGLKTPKRLYAYMELHDVPVPEWLLEMPEMADLNAGVSENTITLLLHQAIATSKVEPELCLA